MFNSQSPAKRVEYNSRYKAKPETKVKMYARHAVQYALRTGKMVRRPCEGCGAEKAHGHHDDYSKPLAVRWLCSRCHTAWHRDHQPIVPGAVERTSQTPRTPRTPRTHCSKGHALTGDNLFIVRNRHCCRQCNRSYQRFQYWTRKAV